MILRTRGTSLETNTLLVVYSMVTVSCRPILKGDHFEPLQIHGHNSEALWCMFFPGSAILHSPAKESEAEPARGDGELKAGTYPKPIIPQSNVHLNKTRLNRCTWNRSACHLKGLHVPKFKRNSISNNDACNLRKSLHHTPPFPKIVLSNGNQISAPLPLLEGH